MNSVYEIVEHSVTGAPYKEKPVVAQAGRQGATVYQLLMKETTPEVVEGVREFAKGKMPIEAFEGQIHRETAYQYLAAAKVVDIDMENSEKQQSTYKIREMALFCSGLDQGGRGEINALNAFSNPPLVKEDVDVLLANELDNSHPIVKRAAFGAERDKHLSRIYTYSQKEAEIIPEIAVVIEAVVKDRIETMQQVSKALSPKTAVVFKGCSGAGKSFALKKLVEPYLQGTSSVDQAVQSTDNLKNDIRTRIGNIFSDQQVHLLGFSTFKMLSEVAKREYPELSTLSEGWFNSVFAIQSLFKDLKEADLALEMYDFDGDYEAICLRILARYADPNSPKPPMESVDRGFKTSRESRGLLLESLRPIDRYQFCFVHKDGRVDEAVDPRSITIDPQGVDAEITFVKKLVITEEHVQIFGEAVRGFVGMTVDAAFEKARGIA